MESRKNTINFAFILFSAAFIFLPSNLKAETYEGTVTKVIDGNTLNAFVNGREIILKLSDIDAPELKQSFGNEAKQFNEKLALNKKIKILTERPISSSTEQVFAEIYVPSKQDSLNQELVRQGLAWANSKKNNLNPYFLTEEFARKKRLSIWSQANSENPSDFREKEAKKETAIKKATAEREAEARVYAHYAAADRATQKRTSQPSEKASNASKENQLMEAKKHDVLGVKIGMTEHQVAVIRGGFRTYNNAVKFTFRDKPFMDLIVSFNECGLVDFIHLTDAGLGFHLTDNGLTDDGGVTSITGINSKTQEKIITKYGNPSSKELDDNGNGYTWIYPGGLTVSGNGNVLEIIINQLAEVPCDQILKNSGEPKF